MPRDRCYRLSSHNGYILPAGLLILHAIREIHSPSASLFLPLGGRRSPCYSQRLQSGDILQVAAGSHTKRKLFLSAGPDDGDAGTFDLHRI